MGIEAKSTLFGDLLAVRLSAKVQSPAQGIASFFLFIPRRSEVDWNFNVSFTFLNHLISFRILRSVFVFVLDSLMDWLIFLCWIFEYSFLFQSGSSCTRQVSYVLGIFAFLLFFRFMVFYSSSLL